MKWTAGVKFPAKVEIFFSSPPLCPDRLWGPPSLLFDGYRGFFPRVKRPGREAVTQVHPVPTLINVCGYTSISSCLHGVVLKHRDNFTLP